MNQLVRIKSPIPNWNQPEQILGITKEIDVFRISGKNENMLFYVDQYSVSFRRLEGTWSDTEWL